MSQSDHEWVAATGLMAALAGVLIVLLAVSRAGGPEIAQLRAEAPQVAAASTSAPAPAAPLPPAAPTPPAPAAAEAAPPPAAPATARRESDGPGLTVVLRQVQTVFAQQGASNLVAVDTEAGKITLKEGAFRRGSACVEPEARAAFAQVEERIAEYLQQYPAGRIYVEGHTDDKPVKAPVTDVRAYCTVYDDNFTLSAARAREARLLLIGRSAPEAARRVIVAGYGDSQPLQGLAASDERNRRVEVRFVNGGERN
ncbi:OmpA family protein [Herbaspirillum sp. WGmk3]|uniref:OmpA/MotB family protein n=1 Tax=Herbaspirillum sp. WGmk3 TaxID=2919925 RepID=UPI0020913740|nr:OmpA family protein [Herbaspirillum sp. WGmk3]MCO4857409.1 OmpA family protein [Herbaspirillum sp. WGmk3]